MEKPKPLLRGEPITVVNEDGTGIRWSVVRSPNHDAVHWEGTSWIRGHHDEDSAEVKALLAAFALSTK